MELWRRIAGWAGTLTIAVAACGCSGTGAAAPGDAAGGRDPRAVVRDAAETLAGSGSSLVRTAMEMASGGTRITISGEGGFDYRERRGRLRLTLPEGGPVTEVFTPGELYTHNRAGVPADTWVWVDVTELPDGNLVTGGATDPLTAAELLRGVSRADDLGTAEVAGQTVRHYRGVTDIGAAADAATGTAAQQLAVAVGGFTDTQVPFDAYVDEQGLLRKVRHRFSFARGGEGVDVTSTVLLYDFGTPVDVALPDPEQVYAGAVA
jgi:hypothetical protein